MDTILRTMADSEFLAFPMAGKDSPAEICKQVENYSSRSFQALVTSISAPLLI
jgi:hypothetical protein